MFYNLSDANSCCWLYNIFMSRARKPRFDHSLIENKWQTKWEKEKIFSPDLKLQKAILQSNDVPLSVG